MKEKEIRCKEIIIHIGLPKTGSTFLQTIIYPKLKDVCKVFGEFGEERFHWDSLLSDDRINIISNEQISGRPNSSFKVADRYTVISRFANMFPKARIIFVSREKKGWIKSLYREYVKSCFGAYSFDRWYDEVFDKDFLMDSNYVDYLKLLFNDVLILDFKELKENHELFVKKTCDFIGVDVPEYTNKIINKGKDDSVIERWRKFNRLFKSNYSPHKGYFPNELNPLRYLHLIEVKKDVW